MDSALENSTPIMAPVQISKKQTVVGNTYFKVFFLIIANFKSYKWQYYCAKPHVVEKAYVKITESNCYFLVQGLRQA